MNFKTYESLEYGNSDGDISLDFVLVGETLMMLLPDTLIIHATIKKKVAQNSMDEILSKIFNMTRREIISLLCLNTEYS